MVAINCVELVVYSFVAGITSTADDVISVQFVTAMHMVAINCIELVVYPFVAEGWSLRRASARDASWTPYSTTA
jgi:hypothetical protein